MPLLDHFHPPWSERRHWESFHAAWATALTDALNEKWLPPGYFAEEMITVGGRVEINVAGWEEPTPSNGRTATLARKTWTPPAPSETMPAIYPDSFSVQVFRGDEGHTLAGAVELVCPANKDRETNRQAFAIKCANYLHQGVGLVVVDIVTSRGANLHNVLVKLLHENETYCMPQNVSIYSVAYRPISDGNKTAIDVWKQPRTLGQDLPTMPLALANSVAVPLDLESTYQDVCRRRLMT